MTRRLLFPLLDGVAYACLLLGLLLLATVTPPARHSEPLQLHWRTATEQEERAYERQLLVDALDEYRRQHP